MTELTTTPIDRDVVVVRGADAGEYLNTQLTQDVTLLEVGDSAWSFLLEPKSEIISLLRISRIEDEAFVIDVESGTGQTVLDRIDGFLFRMEVNFSQEQWTGVALRGPGAMDVELAATLVSPCPWRGVAGVDALDPGGVKAPDVEPMSPAALESLRVRSGWPAMADLASDVTPAMTGLIEDTVSFTKGCYTGQEMVARVHYRGGNPVRQLVQVRFHPCAQISGEDEITVDGEPVGSITSVAACQPVALAYVKRGIELPTAALIGDSPIELIPLEKGPVATTA